MPRNLWIWDYTWGIQQLSWKIEHAKEDLWVNLIETNKLIDEVKIENQSLKVKVDGLEDDLVKFKAKLENVSNLKSVVEPKYKSTLIKPKDVKVYVPPFKRNHNEENDNFSRKDKSKRTVNQFHDKNLPITIVVWLVTLDLIVCKWDLNLKSKLN